MSAETMKMPEPIIDPTTTIVESNRPRPRWNSVSRVARVLSGLAAAISAVLRCSEPSVPGRGPAAARFQRYRRRCQDIYAGTPATMMAKPPMAFQGCVISVLREIYRAATTKTTGVIG